MRLYLNHFLLFELQLKYMSPVSRIREKKTYAVQLEEKLEEIMKKKLRDKRHRLAIYVEKMKGLSPLEKLNSGFSYVADEAGKNVRSVKDIKENEKIQIHVTDGRILAKVTRVAEENL